MSSVHFFNKEKNTFNASLGLYHRKQLPPEGTFTKTETDSDILLPVTKISIAFAAKINLQKENKPELNQNSTHPGKINLSKNKIPQREKQNRSSYLNLILAFFTGAGFAVLLLSLRKQFRKFLIKNNFQRNVSTRTPSKKNEHDKKQHELQEIAARVDRCADRFANSNNEKIELIARKVAIAITKSEKIENAEELEKSFNEIYLSSVESSTIEYLTFNNLLSNDIAYPPPDPDEATIQAAPEPPVPVEAPAPAEEGPLNVVDDLSVSQTVVDTTLDKAKTTTVFADDVKNGVIDMENVENVSGALKVGGSLLGGISVGNDINTISNWDNNTTTTQKVYDVSTTVLDSALLVGGIAAVGTGTVAAALTAAPAFVIAGTVTAVAAKVFIYYNPPAGTGK